MSFSITAIIPVLNRPQNVNTCITSFLGTVPKDKAEMVFITNQDCQEEIHEINKYSGQISVVIAPDDIISWGKRINWGINYSKINYTLENPSSWILCAADDIKFHSGWFEIAEEASENFSGIIVQMI